ncbi:hypothetical protein Hanom_Chr11g01053441 [Helianthus anomalus]
MKLINHLTTTFNQTPILCALRFSTTWYPVQPKKFNRNARIPKFYRPMLKDQGLNTSLELFSYILEFSHI